MEEINLAGVNMTFFDVETAPNKAYVWGLWNQNVGINQIIEPGRTISFASRRYGGSRTVFRSEFHHGHEKMVEDAWAMLDESDVVVTFNGKKFDTPTLNTEFMKRDLGPPSPYKHIDLYQVVRKQFRLPSNKLDYVLRFLGLETKLNNKGMDLWTECMMASSLKAKGLLVPKELKESWEQMKEYNIQDVEIMPALYDRLKPWIKGHPNLSLYVDDNERRCPVCQSTHVQSRGVEHLNVLSYRRYQCMDCKTWLRGSVREERARERDNRITRIA